MQLKIPKQGIIQKVGVSNLWGRLPKMFLQSTFPGSSTATHTAAAVTQATGIGHRRPCLSRYMLTAEAKVVSFLTQASLARQEKLVLLSKHFNYCDKMDKAHGSFAIILCIRKKR